MHRAVTRRLQHRRDERGAVAIIVACSLTVLMVVTAMVMDFGLVRVDRQLDKSAADSAALAGLHGLVSTGDGLSHSAVGVCAAIRYLQVNNPRFSGMSESAGWADGLGAPTANGCSDVTLRAKTCQPANKATWSRFHWNGTVSGLKLDVSIQSGYSLAGSGWTEDALPASSTDTGDGAQQGCDHLAVIITQSRKPGFGSIATASDLTTALRSVGRVKRQPGRNAPALLLLRRTGCAVLTSGSGGSGSGTFVHIFGAMTSNGFSQAGTIHSDSDGVGCTGTLDSRVYLGRQNDGIVAYAAPLVSNPSSPDPAKPGLISSVAAANGVSQNAVRDSLNFVYGTSAISGTGGTKQEVTGRARMGRDLVDERYLPTVRTSVSQAASVFSAGTSAPPAGWTNLAAANPCKPTQAEINALALTAASSLYVNCTANGGFNGVNGGPLVINAGRIFFRGVVAPKGTLQMPNAHHVYVANQGSLADAINISNNQSFEMHTAGNLTSGLCTDGQSASGTNRAMLFVRGGDIKQTAGTLRLCRTTTVMMGGQLGGCLPAGEVGNAPTTTPCPGPVTLGSGQFTQTGGDIDWTAPDALDVTIDADGNTLPTATTGWHNTDGPEDLALWSESATTSSATYNMNGGGVFHVRGVFMVPNADPFSLGGGAAMDLRNAQFITGSIALNGGTQVSMRIDPNSAVTLPDMGLVGLVR